MSADDTRICPRGHWRPSEDEKLRQLVEQYGPQNWNSIAEKLQGRSGKSCRLRWFNQLDPRINKRPFTEEEEERLLSAHKLQGNKWALIARLFPGRTDNAVKNHWHVIMARRQRERMKLFTKHHHLLPTLNDAGFLRHFSAEEFNTGRLFDFRNKPKHGRLFRKVKSSSSSSWAFSTHLSSSPSRDYYSSKYNKYGVLESSVCSTNYKRYVCSGSSGLFCLNQGCSVRVVDKNHEVVSGQEQEQGQGHDQASLRNHEDVHFIDFLGVGISTS